MRDATPSRVARQARRAGRGSSRHLLADVTYCVTNSGSTARPARRADPGGGKGRPGREGPGGTQARSDPSDGLILRRYIGIDIAGAEFLVDPLFVATAQ